MTRDFVAEAAARSAASRDTILSVPPELRLAALHEAIDAGNIAEGSTDAIRIEQSVSDAAASTAYISAEAATQAKAKLFDWLLRVKPLKPAPDAIKVDKASYRHAGPFPAAAPALVTTCPTPAIGWWWQPTRWQTVRRAARTYILLLGCSGAGLWAFMNWSTVSSWAQAAMQRASDWTDATIHDTAVARVPTFIGCSDPALVYRGSATACLTFPGISGGKALDGKVLDQQGDAVKVRWSIPYTDRSYEVWARKDAFARP